MHLSYVTPSRKLNDIGWLRLSCSPRWALVQRFREDNGWPRFGPVVPAVFILVEFSLPFHGFQHLVCQLGAGSTAGPAAPAPVWKEASQRRSVVQEVSPRCPVVMFAFGKFFQYNIF